RRADEPGLSRLRRVVRLEHGGQLYHGRPYDRASSTRGPGRKTCSFAPDVAGLSGIAKPPVSHGLNPTILRQARALALSFSSRRPPSLDRPPLPPERFSPRELVVKIHRFVPIRGRAKRAVSRHLLIAMTRCSPWTPSPVWTIMARNLPGRHHGRGILAAKSRPRPIRGRFSRERDRRQGTAEADG